MSKPFYYTESHCLLSSAHPKDGLLGDIRVGKKMCKTDVLEAYCGTSHDVGKGSTSGSFLKVKVYVPDADPLVGWCWSDAIKVHFDGEDLKDGRFNQ